MREKCEIIDYGVTSKSKQTYSKYSGSISLLFTINSILVKLPAAMVVVFNAFNDLLIVDINIETGLIWTLETHRESWKN